jgi:hypothetical protein
MRRPGDEDDHLVRPGGAGRCGDRAARARVPPLPADTKSWVDAAEAPCSTATMGRFATEVLEVFRGPRTTPPLASRREGGGVSLQPPRLLLDELRRPDRSGSAGGLGPVGKRFHLTGPRPASRPAGGGAAGWMSERRWGTGGPLTGSVARSREPLMCSRLLDTFARTEGPPANRTLIYQAPTAGDRWRPLRTARIRGVWTKRGPGPPRSRGRRHPALADLAQAR